MNYITTNIRFEKDEYFKLKAEAAKRRKSLSAVVREKIGLQEKNRSQVEVDRLMATLRRHAAENAKYLKGVDGTKIIREMRDNAKW